MDRLISNSLYIARRAGPNKLLEITLKKPLEMSILALHFKIIESYEHTFNSVIR